MGGSHERGVEELATGLVGQHYNRRWLKFCPALRSEPPHQMLMQHRSNQNDPDDGA